MAKSTGLNDILELVLELIFVAYLAPIGLTALATSAFTSVSSTVTSLIQTVLSIVFAMTIIFLFVRKIRGGH